MKQRSRQCIMQGQRAREYHARTLVTCVRMTVPVEQAIKLTRVADITPPPPYCSNARESDTTPSRQQPNHIYIYIYSGKEKNIHLEVGLKCSPIYGVFVICVTFISASVQLSGWIYLKFGFNKCCIDFPFDNTRELMWYELGAVFVPI